jgi:hypothetical protein
MYWINELQRGSGRLWRIENLTSRILNPNHPVRIESLYLIRYPIFTYSLTCDMLKIFKLYQVTRTYPIIAQILLNTSNFIYNTFYFATDMLWLLSPIMSLWQHESIRHYGHKDGFVRLCMEARYMFTWKQIKNKIIALVTLWFSTQRLWFNIRTATGRHKNNDSSW